MHFLFLAALAALRRKKALETEQTQVEGIRMTIEAQLSALETANFNAQTIAAMTSSAKVLQDIHKQMNVDDLDNIMDKIREEMETAKYISQMLSDPTFSGVELDDVSALALSLCSFGS